MKNDIRSHGLWEASAPAPIVTSPLFSVANFDVVIVGAGYTGLSAALHLAENGAKVAVLEAVEIGYGGSGRNVGLVNAGMWMMPELLTVELGMTYGTRLLKLLSDAPSVVFDIVQKHGIPCEAVRNGTLHCAVGNSGLKEIKERARQWQTFGAPVRLLDANETARKVGTNAYVGSLLDLRAGTIQPLAYARGLASAAQHAGAIIHTGTQVTRLEDSGNCWQIHTNTGAIVKAPFVIAATNAYSDKLGLWSKLRTELVHLPYFNLATQPLSATLRKSILPELQGVWDTCQVLSSYRFDEAGRLIFGSVGAFKGFGTAIHKNWGRRALTKLFPQLVGLDFEHEWYGMIGMTGNSLPRFHKLGRNIFSFSGFNGRGIAPGTTFGRELARLVLGQVAEEDLPLPLSQPEKAEFSLLKESYYEIGAQIAHAFGARL